MIDTKLLATMWQWFSWAPTSGVSDAINILLWPLALTFKTVPCCQDNGNIGTFSKSVFVLHRRIWSQNKFLHRKFFLELTKPFWQTDDFNLSWNKSLLKTWNMKAISQLVKVELSHSKQNSIYLLQWKWYKMLFISLQNLFSISRYLIFCRDFSVM